MKFDFESENTLKKPKAESLLEIDAAAEIVCFVQGIGDQGASRWAYIGVKPSRYESFHASGGASHMVTLSEHRRIILEGVGAFPTEPEIAYMREHYGCDPDYQRSLMAEVRRQQLESHNRQEESRMRDILTKLKADGQEN